MGPFNVINKCNDTKSIHQRHRRIAVLNHFCLVVVAVKIIAVVAVAVSMSCLLH